VPPNPTVLRLLVVDDNVDAARSFSMLVAAWGYQSRVAHDGAAALAVAAEFRPDVVLLDLGLPGMDGYEVARRLRELPGIAGVVLVAMTGFTDDLHRRQADAAGFSLYLVKPADLTLLEAFLSALARKRATQPKGD
jgi:CheY-like chemotaxis protein